MSFAWHLYFIANHEQEIVSIYSKYIIINQ